MARKKKYKGVVIRNFGIDGVQFVTGNPYETTNKERYDHLINIKRIK